MSCGSNAVKLLLLGVPCSALNSRLTTTVLLSSPQYPVPATYTKGRPFDWAPSPALAPAPSPTGAAAPRAASIAATAALGALVLLLCAALLG